MTGLCVIDSRIAAFVYLAYSTLLYPGAYLELRGPSPFFLLTQSLPTTPAHPFRSHQRSTFTMSTKKPVPRKAHSGNLSDVFDLYPDLGTCGRGELCFDCEAQFRQTNRQSRPELRHNEALSIADAKRKVGLLSRSINGNILYLHDKLSGHGNSIVKRWTKKTPAERSAILVSAFPKIPQKQQVKLSFMWKLQCKR